MGCTPLLNLQRLAGHSLACSRLFLGLNVIGEAKAAENKYLSFLFYQLR
jgi:hypothetical protein